MKQFHWGQGKEIERLRVEAEGPFSCLYRGTDKRIFVFTFTPIAGRLTWTQTVPLAAFGFSLIANAD